MPSAIEITGNLRPEFEELLSPEALDFLADLARAFEPRRKELMQARASLQAEIDAGRLPDFLPETKEVRERDWRVAPAPEDLVDRRVEITGPCSDRKMVINALNSGAQVYMSDLEDSHSPGWSQTMEGQINLRDAARGDIEFTDPSGTEYRLKDRTATLNVRPRGLHLVERHVLVDGEPISASLFDFGLYLFHSAQTLIERGTGPYVYLPKLQAHTEARFWNDVFLHAQEQLGLAPGTIRATVLIEHILAAFEMEEVLYELRDHITGLNLGRWDYIFSFIKTFRPRRQRYVPGPGPGEHGHPLSPLGGRAARPDLPQAGRPRPGRHVRLHPAPGRFGGQRAGLRPGPDRQGARGIPRVRRRLGGHPGLVPTVQEVFQQAFPGSNQLNYVPEVRVTAQDLLQVPEGEITEAGLRNDVSVALQYLDALAPGPGARWPINALMEDRYRGDRPVPALAVDLARRRLSDGGAVTKELYLKVRTEETAKFSEAVGPSGETRLTRRRSCWTSWLPASTFTEFLTLPGYESLE